MENKYLDEFRNKYPMYKDMDNTTLAKNIHQTFYKDMDENEYMAKLGIYPDMPNDKKEEAISQYKTTTPNDWGDKIEKDLGSIGNSINGLFNTKEDAQAPADIATTLTPENNSNPKVELNNILNTNKENIDIPDVPTLRTSTEAMGDTFHAMGAGVGNVIKGAGTISGLVTGDMNNPVVQFGSQISDDFKDQYSSQKKQWDKEDREKINAQDGEINKAIQVLKNYTDTPQNIVMDLTEQIPQIGAMFLGGAGTKATAEVLGATPKIAGKVGTTGAITTEAGLSGADSGGDAYESIMRLPDEVWNNSPEYQILIKNGIEPNKAKEAMALEESRFAAGITGALTFGLNKFLPNADMIEKALAGDMSGIAAKGLAGKAAGVASETFVEGADEAQSKINSNIAIGNINPNQELLSGVGEATAKGAVLGGVTSGGIAIADGITPKSDEQKKQIIGNELNKSIENADLQQENILNQLNPNQAYYQQQNINNSPTSIVEETPIVNKQLEDITQGFAKLQEEIKANNKKPIEELLQKDLEVKVSDEPTANPILDNNIITNQEVQNQDSTLPVPTVEEISNQSAINADENANVYTQTNGIDSQIPQSDEKQIESTLNSIGQKVTYSTNNNNSKIVNTEIYEGLNYENQYNESANGVFYKSKTIKDGELKSQTDYILNNNGVFVDGLEINILSNQSDTTPFIGTKEQRKQIIDLMVEKETATSERANEIDEQVENIVLNTNKSSQGDESITEKNKIDETQWHSIPDDMDVKISQGSNRANELTIKDLNKNNDPYIYETAEVQGEQGVSNTINRRLATNEELTQKNKNRLIDTKFQNFFDNGKIDEDGFMTTKSMSKEQFKEFNDYIKENNIGSYINKKYSQGGKTGFKIDNQDVINTWFKKDENSSPTPEIDSVVKENLISENQVENIVPQIDESITNETKAISLDELKQNNDIKKIFLSYKGKRLKDDLKYLNETKDRYGETSPQYLNKKQRYEDAKDTYYDEYFYTQLEKMINEFDNTDFERIHSTFVNGIGFDLYKKAIEKIRPIQFGTTKTSSAYAINQYFNNGYNKFLEDRAIKKESEKKDKEFQSLINYLEKEEVTFENKKYNLKEFYDKIFSDGYTQIDDYKKGAITRYRLSNPQINKSFDIKKIDVPYIEHLQEQRAEEQSRIEEEDIKNNPDKYLNEDEINHLFKRESKSDIIKQDNTEVKEDGNNTNSRAATTDKNSNTEINQPRVSDEKSSTANTDRIQSSERELSNGQRADDSSDNVSSRAYGVSAEDERVGGYRTNEDNQPNNEQPIDDNTILSEPINSNSNELNYNLKDKEPIALTRGQRKEANAKVQELIKKPIEEITPADKEILRLHTGDGGLDEVTEGSFNQHFTSYKTISSIYAALDNSGFKFDKVLEPAVGSGNFIGFAPNKTWDVVDIDNTNIEVVKRLYPQVRKVHNETFETFTGKNYDLIISNVPFASATALTREYVMTIKPQFKAIHNFYFAHALDKVKDNGMLVFMTSTSTLDGSTEAKKLREYIITKADVLGTFRLPENSQRANTHTDTMIDIIFLQKRPEGMESRQNDMNQKFVNIIEFDGYPINNHLIAQKGVLGKLEVGNDRTKMGKVGWIVTGEPKYENMKINYEPYEVKKESKKEETNFDTYEDFIKYADENEIEFSIKNKVNDLVVTDDNKIIVYDTNITFNDDNKKVVVGKVLNSTNSKKINSLNTILKYAEEYQETKNPNAKVRALNEIESYKEVYKKSPHSDTQFKTFMKQHNADKLYKELISYFDKDFNPAAIFEEDVRFKDSGKVEVSSLSSLEERALSYENTDGIINLSDDYSLVTPNEIMQLLENNQYAVIGKQKIQNAYMYYAGNIYKRIDDLNAQYAIDNITKEQYERQLKSLEDIKPKTTEWKNIRFKGNESWFPKEVSEKFIVVKEDEYFGKDGIFDNDKYYEIYSNYLNGVQLVKRDQKNETVDEHRERLLEANKLLQNEILPQIKSFVEKLGSTDIVEEAYNRASSFYVPPKLTGQLLKDLPTQFRGKPFSMQSHQLEGAELVVYNKKGVIAFAPGGGKTITAIVAVRQLLNQGVMKKPLFVVPVNTIAQWEETVRELYPDAKVFEFPKLKSGPNKGQAKEWSQLSKDEKEQIVYDLSNNRYDFTIIGDTAFQKIGLSDSIIERYATDLVNEITQMEEAENEEAGKKQKKNEVSIESKKRAFIRGIKEQYSGDVTIDIEKLGFDAIIADEVQNYKNIGMQGKDVRGNLGGSVSVTYSQNGQELTQKDIADGIEPDSAKLGSWRAYDFRFKTRYISEKNNGNNVILLTGTPTPNKPLELMTILHHLDVNILKEYGIDNVSDFVSTFFEIADFETTDGQGKPKIEQGLSSIRNTQWLKKIIKRFVNYKGFEDMPDLPRPKQIDIQHFLSLSPAGEQIFTDIKDRLIKAIEDSKDKNKSKDNVEQTISMYMAGRDASIDLRLYNVGTKGKSAYTQQDINEVISEDSATTLNNKVDKTVELVVEQYKKNKQSGQLIFNDRIKYKDINGVEKSIHQEIKNKLLESGLFESNEVVIVTGQQYTNPDTGHDYKLGTTIKNTMLQRIMDKYNAGEIKVIIGNTAKLGVGVDLNRYTTDIYQIDIPFRPDWIEQRNNRGVRQGNINKEVRVHSFFQLGTFDQFSFDLIKKKEGFNNIFWKDTETEYATIDKGDQLDPYEMVIQVEPDIFKREKLRLERILDRGQFELKDIEKKQRKYEAEILTKESLINGELGYIKRIDRLEEELKPKNYPKYENVKDENEKAKKIDEHIKRINERIQKEKSRIKSTKEDIEHLKDLVEKTKKDFADKKAQIEMVTSTFVFNGRVSLDLIKEEYTAEQLLKKEGKSTEQIKEYINNEKNNTSYMRTSDEAMPNNPESLTGKQSIRVDNTMILRDKEVSLPDKFTPMTPAKIRKQVIDIIGNRLYFSKIKEKAAGFYRKKTGETRIKEINNVEVYAHEMAHYLDFYNGNRIFRNAYKDTRFKNEVESFSYTKNKDQIGIEGFAEFVRAWLTQYEFAKTKAPNFTQEFEMLLKETGLETKMNQLQEDMHKWYNQGDEAMFSALIGDKKSKLDALKEIIFNIKHTIMNKSIINLFDRTHGFSVAEFTMFNKLQKAEQSPTKLLRLALGGSSATYEAVIKWGTPKLTAKGDLTFSGKGLADIFEPVLKQGANEFKELMEYFAAVQANEMMRQGKKTPFSQSQINTILERGNQKPIYKKVFKEYQEFNDRMLDFYIDMNYLTVQDVENFKNKNSVYVPMQRVVESMGQKDGYAGGFFGRKGSDRNIRDIEKNITEQLFNHIKGAMVAHAKSKLFSQLSRHEDGSLFAVRLAPDSKKVKVNIEQQAKKIVEVLYDAGMMLDSNGDVIEIEENVTLEEAINNTIDVLIMKPNLMNFISFGHKPKNTGSHIEEVIINGERKYFEVQTGELGDILNITLNNLGGVQYGWFMGALYSIKNFKTRVITAMPQFKLPNFIRDTLDAQVFRKTKKPINPLSGAKSYFTIDDAFKNYMLNGGGYGTLLEGTNSASPKDIFEETKLQKLDRFMSFDEYANRVAVAENAIEEGNNWMEAAYQGRDLTVDFSMVGANPLLRHILKLIPFQQAAMNGMYKLIREIKDEGHNPSTYAKAVARLSIKGFTYLTPIAIASFLMSEDDDRYKALTADELARFVWFFYDKNEQPIKIPVPFGLGAIFQKFPEYIISSLFSDGDFVDNRYSDAIMFAVTHQMIAVPNGGIFDPIIQDMINKKFTGSPIVTPELQKVAGPLQYTNSTPLFYKELGSATGLSPVRLEHYTKGVLGYVESAITGMTQMALWDKDKWGEMPYSSTSDYVHSTFFKQFYKMNETSRSAWSEEYYKYKEKIDEAFNSIQFSNKQVVIDHGEEYEKYLNNKDKMTLSGLKKATTNIDKINASLYKAENLIIHDKNLTAKEKEDKLEELYKEKTKMFKEVYKQLNPILKEVK